MKVFSGIKQKEKLNLGLFSVSIIPIILFIFVVSQRIALPFDLEWGEGAGINQIYRILSGEQLYTAPSLSFAPLVYTPFYYWLSSLLCRITKHVILTARMISMLATLGSVGIIAWLVVKETRNQLAGWLAGAVYLACFALSDAYYDLIRVDSLYVFILLLAFLFLRVSSKPTGLAAAGLAIALGFFTKQSTLIVFLPLIAFLMVRFWKSSWPLLMTTVIGIVLPWYWLDARSGGWFTYYILRLPREHGYSFVSAVDFWVGDLLGPLGIAVGFGMFFILYRLWGGLSSTTSKDFKSSGGMLRAQTYKDDERLHTLFYLYFVLGAVGAAWITRASNGGGANNAMSAYAAVAMLFGLGFNIGDDLVKNISKNGDIVRAAIYGLVAIQFIGLMYNPFNFIPSDQEVEATNQLIVLMEEVEGPTWIPYRSHLPRAAGKDAFIHAVNLFELTGYFKGNVLPEGRELVDEIQEEICYQSYGMIVLDQPIPWVEMQLETAYQKGDLITLRDKGRRSSQLSWQGGFDDIYFPVEDYDLKDCLSSIENDGDG